MTKNITITLLLFNFAYDVIFVDEQSKIFKYKEPYIISSDACSVMGFIT